MKPYSSLDILRLQNVTDAVYTLNCSNFMIMGLGLRCVSKDPTRIIQLMWPRSGSHCIVPKCITCLYVLHIATHNNITSTEARHILCHNGAYHYTFLHDSWVHIRHTEARHYLCHNGAYPILCLDDRVENRKVESMISRKKARNLPTHPKLTQIIS